MKLICILSICQGRGRSSACSGTTARVRPYLLKRIPDLQEYSILIIDDTPANLGVIADYLDEHGFDIVTARNGEDGIERAKYVRPGLILLDVMMPGIDGFETCRRLKANEATRDIPVIFMTALAGEEDKVKGFEAGGVDYVTKPIQQREVLARVTTHLRIQGLAHELQKANRALSKRAIQLEISRQVGQRVTSILNLDELLKEVVSLIRARFGYYFTGVLLLTEQPEWLVLRAGARPKGQSGPEPEGRLAMDTPNSIIVWVCKTGQSYVSNDVKHDSKYLPIEALPDTRSELALPLRIGQQVIGVLDIQSDQPDVFTLEDGTVLQTLADQIAVAIQNARLYQSEQEIRRKEEERARKLAKLNADKDRFFSSISDDLRRPFNTLLGHSHMILRRMERLTKEEIGEMVEQIYSSAGTVHSLVETLMTWSSLQRVHMNYPSDEVNLRHLAYKVVELYRDTAVRKNIELTNDIQEDILVCADETMLEAIMRNLLDNALKFTLSGGWVTLSVRAAAQNKFVEVSIVDMGIGISRENMGKLFKINAPHTTPGTAQEKGAGLGLIMCQEIVEHNGGRVWIESEPGRGTTVRFTVPVAGLGGCI